MRYPLSQRDGIRIGAFDMANLVEHGSIKTIAAAIYLVRIAFQMNIQAARVEIGEAFAGLFADQIEEARTRVEDPVERVLISAPIGMVLQERLMALLFNQLT